MIEAINEFLDELEGRSYTNTRYSPRLFLGQSHSLCRTGNEANYWPALHVIQREEWEEGERGE